MAKMKLYIVEKTYSEVEINNVDDYEDAREKFYENQSEYMQKRKRIDDYIDTIEVYDREWCD